MRPRSRGATAGVPTAPCRRRSTTPATRSSSTSPRPSSRARATTRTSIDDLVEATGLKRGGLYHYISRKEDLLIAAHERFIVPLLENARAIAAESLPADEALRRIAHALMHDIAVYQDQVTVFLHEWRVIRDAPDWDHVREARHEFEQIIQSIFEQGQEDGVFDVSAPRLTVLAFLGMVNYSYTWYSPRGSHTPAQIADHFAGIFLSGIRAHA